MEQVEKKSLMEQPCEETGKSCEWISEEHEDEQGNLIWDSFCFRCCRSRDWSLEEYEE
jgi:uncharacterized membrane protein YcaP (DUF421 family)